MARREYNIRTGASVDLPDHAPEPAPVATPAELQAQYTAALDGFIDMTALRRGYDSRITCALRAAYPGPYQAEGLAFAQWMDTCYQQGTQALTEVLAGKRKAPTIDAFLKSLPPMEWPTQKGV